MRRLAITTLCQALIVIGPWAAHAATPQANPTVAVPPANAADAGTGETMIVAIVVNGRRIDDNALVVKRRGDYLVARPLLIAAGITLDAQTVSEPGPGTVYVALNSIRGLHVQFDAASQSLLLRAGPGTIASRAINATVNPAYPTIDRDASGGFLNYDLVGQGGDAREYLAAYVEGGAAIAQGMVISSGLANTASHDPGLVRLDTAYVYDATERATRFKFGDAIARGGDWGRPYRFGGLQIATNFDVQPGFVPFPVPAYAGNAALPSTVQVFVDNAPKFQGSVDQGPFSINQIPTTLGAGNARVVVTDALGRQDSVYLPFYLSPRLLKEGVSSFSYEAGFLRTGYQVDSWGYDEPIASLTHRYGIDDTLTVEGHSDLTVDHQILGGSLTKSVIDWGEFRLESAVALTQDSPGYLYGLGWSRYARPWNFGLRQRWTTSSFENPAIVGHLKTPRSETIANVGLSMARWGSLSLSLTRQSFDDAPDTTIASAAWMTSLRDDTFLSLYVLGAEQAETDYTVGFTLTYLFGSNNNVALDSYNRSGRSSSTVQARHVPQNGRGFGYGATAGFGETDRIGSDVIYRSAIGDFGAAVERFDNQTNGRLTASGGIAMVDGKAFASQRIDDSFALVSIPGRAGVTVMQENRPIGKTDSDGDLLIPKLISNYPTKIGFDENDLPIDVEVKQRERLVASAYRHPVVVKYDVESNTPVRITLRRANGKNIPPGSIISARAGGDTYHVGFGGESYLPAVAGAYDIDDGTGRCTVQITAAMLQAAAPSAICEVRS